MKPLIACVAVGLVMAGCSSDEGTAAGDAGNAGADAGEVRSCKVGTDCARGETCSAARRCMPEGGCLVDGDCPSGQHCGTGSRRCFSGDACAVDDDCGKDMKCDAASGQCALVNSCGASEFQATRLAPNMMILLDRSGSMGSDVDGRSRWEIAKDAVKAVTERYDTVIRFGLATFSSCLPLGCSAGSIVVPVADVNGAAINGFLAPLLSQGSPDGSPPAYLCDSGNPETSTGKSLQALLGEPTLGDRTHDNFVLLVTDGAESEECTSLGTVTGATGAAALLSQDPSVKTYVVGFSRDVPADQLQAVATAGGTGAYLQADDAAALLAALETIAAAVATCEYRLDGSVTDPSLIHVYFNNDPAGLPGDDADGWTYDPASGRITFNGASCERIKEFTVTDIDVVYGCEGPTPL